MPRNGYFIIDTHHHVGSLEALGTVTVPAGLTPEQIAQAEMDSRLSTMDQTGVDQAILLPGHLYLRPNGLADTQRINDGIARYRDEHPDRFPAAVGIVEPLYGDLGLGEIERIKKDLDLVGVTFHMRFQGVGTNSPLVVKLVQRMAQLGMVPLVHAVPGIFDESLWRVHELADAVPDTTIIVLDAFGSHESAREVMSVAKAAPNLVFDSSLTHSASWIERLAEELGPERVIFGTDVYSHFDPELRNPTLELLLDMKVSDEAKQAILAGNVQRILLGKKG